MRFHFILILLCFCSLGIRAQKFDSDMERRVMNFIWDEKFDEADAILDSVLLAHPHQIRSQCLQSISLHRRGEKEAAFAKLDTLIQLYPLEVDPLFVKADLFREEEEFDRAISVLIMAEKLCKGHDTCTYRLNLFKAYVWLDQYDYGKALPLFKENVAIFPKSYEANVYMAFTCSYLPTEYKRALQYSRKAYKISRTGDVESLISYVYCRQGRYKKAIRILEPLVYANPDNSFMISNLGVAYAHTGMPYQGLDLINKALAIDSTGLHTYRNLGLTYLVQNNTDLACQAFGRAIELCYTEVYGNDVLELQKEYCK